MTLSLSSAGEILFLLQRFAEERTMGDVLVKHADRNAKIYFVNGKVLWAFATGQKESFQGILLRESLISKEQLLKGINESRAQNKKNLEDILVFLGVSDSSLRRRIILKHTRAAFDTMLSWGDVTVDVIPKPVPSEGIALAFPLSEVLGDEDSPPPKRTDVPEILSRLREEIPNVKAVILIDGQAGVPIAALVENESFDTEVAAAFYRDIFKSVHDARHALSSSDEPQESVEEVLISTPSDSILVCSLEGSPHLLFLILGAEANLAQARIVVKESVRELNELLS